MKQIVIYTGRLQRTDLFARTVRYIYLPVRIPTRNLRTPTYAVLSRFTTVQDIISVDSAWRLRHNPAWKSLQYIEKDPTLARMVRGTSYAYIIIPLSCITSCCAAGNVLIYTRHIFRGLHRHVKVYRCHWRYTYPRLTRYRILELSDAMPSLTWHYIMILYSFIDHTKHTRYKLLLCLICTRVWH